MSILDKITVKQYVALAKELKERHEYLNVEQTSTSLFTRLFPSSSTSSSARISKARARCILMVRIQDSI